MCLENLELRKEKKIITGTNVHTITKEFARGK